MRVGAQCVDKAFGQRGVERVRQRYGHVGGTIVAILRLLGDTLEDNVRERGGNIGIDQSRRCWDLVEMLHKDSHSAFTAKGRDARYHFIENNA